MFCSVTVVLEHVAEQALKQPTPSSDRGDNTREAKSIPKKQHSPAVFTNIEVTVQSAGCLHCELRLLCLPDFFSFCMALLVKVQEAEEMSTVRK